MRTIKTLEDAQIILKELLDWKDTQISKAKDQRGHQIKNAGDATDPTDLVTLRQLQGATGAKIVKGTTIIQTTTSGSGGGGGVGIPGPQGPAGPQGIPGTSGTLVHPVEEIPSGTMNGTNKTFTLSQIPLSGTLILQLNGVIQALGVEFILSGSTVTYLSAPKAADWQVAQYFY